jgi:hypothetical protein
MNKHVKDYYESQEECKKFHRNVQSNSRYRNFTQTHFTAGDEEQFQSKRNMTNGDLNQKYPSLHGNLFSSFKEQDGWLKNKDISGISVNNTFRYMFNKLKKGIFVQIRNGKVSVFLPFSKANFVNEWGHKIRVDPKYYRDIPAFVEHIHKVEGKKDRNGVPYRFNPRNVNNIPSTWYSNNCLVRLEYPLSESDTNIPNMRDMMIDLCKNRSIPDIEFFINRRDFPVMRNDGTEPYNHIWDGHIPLVSHNYESYSPILSMTSQTGFADVAIPTGEDWARVSAVDGKFFKSSKCNQPVDMEEVGWNCKTPIAVFRGGSTGCGVTPETNTRLKVSKMSAEQKDNILIDAGITNWNVRTRKLEGKPFLQTLEVDTLGFGLVNRLTKYEQSKFKYIINIDGHVAAFRLSEELGMKSCILKVDSSYSLWYSGMLEPNVHYIPIKKDLSDLFQKVEWCRSHDNECKTISENAHKFYTKYLQKDGCLDRLQAVLVTLKKKMGEYVYNIVSPRELQYRYEYNDVTLYKHPSTKKTIDDISEIPIGGRCYGKLKGINGVVNMLISQGRFTEGTKGREIIMSGSDKAHSVQLRTLKEYEFAVKQSPDVVENIHEVFIGTRCTNNLLKKVPNFAYIFGAVDGGKTVVSEYIRGSTLDKVLENSFNMRDYIFFMLQLALALQIAQNTCAFVHYNLTPCNIVMQLLPEAINVEYAISEGEVYTVQTRIVPMIIDYGKSHAVYDGNHYGNFNVHMYRTSTIHDIVTLLFTTMKKIINMHRLNTTDQKIMIDLANFVSDTSYMKNKFRNFFELKGFLLHATKYSTLIMSMGTLERKTPMDFVNYILTTVKMGFPIQKVAVSMPAKIGMCNERQVFNYILSGSDQEKAETFASIFRRILKCNLPSYNNVFMNYFSQQIFEQTLQNIYRELVKFLKARDLDTETYNDIYLNSFKRLDDFYEPLKRIKPVNVTYNLFGNVEEFEDAYSDDIFSDPREALILIKSLNTTSNLAVYKNIVEEVLLYSGMSRLPNDVAKFYKKNFKPLLDANSVAMINNHANYQTLLKTGVDIYSNNLVEIKPSKHIINYIKHYKEFKDLNSE